LNVVAPNLKTIDVDRFLPTPLKSDEFLEGTVTVHSSIKGLRKFLTRSSKSKIATNGQYATYLDVSFYLNSSGEARSEQKSGPPVQQAKNSRHQALLSNPYYDPFDGHIR
jgi:hypothetical protein